MSELTRQEVLAKKREQYARAGKAHKAQILDELVELFGYHRKAAVRALRPRARGTAPFARGRPKEYHPDRLLPPLKAIWLAALQPCGEAPQGRPARLAPGLRAGPSPARSRRAPGVARRQPRHP